MLKFIKAERWHARRMARIGLRPADVAECLAIGLTAREGLITSLEDSETAWCGIGEDGKPAVLFGVCRHPHIEGAGIPWLLATPKLSAKDLIRESPRFIQIMHRKFSMLVNMVHARNTRAIRWLQWAGFKLGIEREHGPNKALFIPFIRTI